MSEEIKKDKDFVIAKMNHKVAISTAIISGIVTLAAVLIPMVNAKQASDTASQISDTKVTSAATPTEETTPTATPTIDKKGNGKDK